MLYMTITKRFKGTLAINPIAICPFMISPRRSVEKYALISHSQVVFEAQGGVEEWNLKACASDDSVLSLSVCLSIVSASPFPCHWSHLFHPFLCVLWKLQIPARDSKEENSGHYRLLGHLCHCHLWPVVNYCQILGNMCRQSGSVDLCVCVCVWWLTGKFAVF